MSLISRPAWLGANGLFNSGLGCRDERFITLTVALGTKKLRGLVKGYDLEQAITFFVLQRRVGQLELLLTGEKLYAPPQCRSSPS
jgi:hypothetical protein